MLRPIFVQARSAATVRHTGKSVLVSSILNRRSVPFAIQMGTRMIPVTMQESADIANGASMSSKMYFVRIVLDTAMTTSSMNDSTVDLLIPTSPGE